MSNSFKTPVVLELADFSFPAISELPDGVIVYQNVWVHPGAGGLYDKTGQPIFESFLRRGFDLQHYPHARPEPFNVEKLTASASEKVVERVVYVPYASMFHFGHMLTEFAGNLGPLLEHANGLDRIGGIGSLLLVPGRAAPFCSSLAELFRLPSHRLLSTASLIEPLRVLQATIPRPSMINRHGLACRHFTHVRQLLARLYGVNTELSALSEFDRGVKLYLSRSRLPIGARHIIEEENLEKELTGVGWRIIYPEQLTITEQLAHLSDAHMIAGCVGSAMHLLMAFGDFIGRRRMIGLGETAAHSNPNIALQAARQRMPFRHIVCLERQSSSDKNLRFLMSPKHIAAFVEALAADPRW